MKVSDVKVVGLYIFPDCAAWMKFNALLGKEPTMMEMMGTMETVECWWFGEASEEAKVRLSQEASSLYCCPYIY